MYWIRNNGGKEIQKIAMQKTQKNQGLKYFTCFIFYGAAYRLVFVRSSLIQQSLNLFQNLHTASWQGEDRFLEGVSGTIVVTAPQFVGIPYGCLSYPPPEAERGQYLT